MTQPWPSVGQQCICIKSDEWRDIGTHQPSLMGRSDTWPSYRQRLTVRAVVPLRNGEVGLLFAEIVNPPHKFRYETHERTFAATRFRPLHTATESEDRAVFRRIADLAGVDEALRRLEGVE